MSEHALPSQTLDRRAVQTARTPWCGWSPAASEGEAGGAAGRVITAPLAPIAAIVGDEADAVDRYLQQGNTFVTTLAHEIRQPLSVLRSAIEALRLEHRSEMSDRITEAMKRQLSQMDRLVGDIVDAARFSRGKVTLRIHRIDARDVIRDAVTDVMPDVSSRNQVLTVFAGPTPLWIDADPQRLHQALSNLLCNAVKYTRTGGRITLTAEGRATTLTIRVCDSGRGIAPDVLPHIFDLFVQGGSSQPGGLGVGLSVVQEIVALHEGRIEARSAGVNLGSEFVVSLPLAAPFAVRVARPPVALIHLAVPLPLVVPSPPAVCRA